MPAGNLHISKALSNLSSAYRNTNYISMSFMGTVPVMKESDQIWIHTRDWRTVQSQRANGAEANEVTWSASTTTYTLYEDALRDIVTDRTRMNSDDVFQIDRDTTEFLTDKIWINIEDQVATLCFTTTTWSNNAGITATGWGLNTTTSLPMLNVASATTVIQRSSGKTPNTVVMGDDTFNGMAQNADILDRIKYTQRGVITQELLSSMFSMRVFVGRASKDISEEGQSDSISAIWTGDALVGYFAERPSLKTPSAGFLMQRTQSGNPFRVKKWRVEERAGDMIEVSAFVQGVAIGTQAAYLFKGASGV